MPCLYDMAMFIQDDLMEQYFEAKGFPDTEENGIPTTTFRFNNALTSQVNFDLAQQSYRR